MNNLGTIIQALHDSEIAGRSRCGQGFPAIKFKPATPSDTR